MATSQVLSGDCVEVMARMPAASVDAVVCDPPYGLEFMGKEWDRLSGQPGYNERGRITVRPDSEVPYGRGGGVNSYQAGRPMQEWHERWAREALRVLKPGGYLLAFGGTRTYHRLACAIEDAGFEIRDRILVEGVGGAHPVELDWLYGSGFPKSLDVSKAIDKAAGAEREVLREATYEVVEDGNSYGAGINTSKPRSQSSELSAPATDDAKRWDGWGTALKPAHEPVCVARKPLTGTVVGNVLAHGTGALNIDGCRVGADKRPVMVRTETVVGANAMAGQSTGATSNGETTTLGRWPANVVLLHREDCVRVGERRVKTGMAGPLSGGVGAGVCYSPSASNEDGIGEHGFGHADEDGMETVEAWECVEGCPVAALDAQSGESKSSGGNGAASQRTALAGHVYGEYAGSKLGDNAGGLGDTGGASRFFYCAKASRAERNAGLVEYLPRARRARKRRQAELSRRHAARCVSRHPTVKPVELMRWLVRLVTPPGGTVMDPFLGSGTTGIAAALEGFDFVGVEREAEYVPIAEARIAYWAEYGEAALLAERRAVTASAKADRGPDQLGLGF